MRIMIGFASLVVIAVSVVPASAFEGTKVGTDPILPVAVSPPASASAVAKAIPTKDDTLVALQYAADGGHPIAQWKLGRMYATGNGVAHDDLRAFGYFSRVANAHAEDNPHSPQARIVANAFVQLGRYYLEGIPNSRVPQDPHRAREMFVYAASYFGDPDAQYSLARLYLEGTGMTKDPKYAARWLGLAAAKGQHEAQALLGKMLFNGEHLPRQAARGLMWITLARDSATPDETWITDLYDSAMRKASDDDRTMALHMIERWVQGKRN